MESKPGSIKRESIKHGSIKKSTTKQEEDQLKIETKRKALVFERRILFFCTLLVGVALLVWSIAFNTQGWFTVQAEGSPLGIYMNQTRRYFVMSRSGLFRICRTTRRNATALPNEVCKAHEMFPTPDKLRTDPSLDETIVKYTKAEMFFSVTSVLLMLMGFLFSIYTFRNPRYMFKRLAAGIHFLSGSCVVVVMEVVSRSIEYERLHLPFVHPPTATYTYGFSYYMGWFVVASNYFSAIVFIRYSKKRKGDKALTEEMALADEPTIIGR